VKYVRWHTHRLIYLFHMRFQIQARDVGNYMLLRAQKLFGGMCGDGAFLVGEQCLHVMEDVQVIAIFQLLVEVRMES